MSKGFTIFLGVAELPGGLGVIFGVLAQLANAVHKKLTFDILTDLHLKVAEQFRLVFTLPHYLHDFYKLFGSALDRFHDESEYRLPITARYVIAKKGIIRAADVNAD